MKKVGRLVAVFTLVVGVSLPVKAETSYYCKACGNEASKLKLSWVTVEYDSNRVPLPGYPQFGSYSCGTCVN